MNAALVIVAFFSAGMAWLLVAIAIDHISDALEERAARRRQMGRPLRIRPLPPPPPDADMDPSIVFQHRTRR